MALFNKKSSSTPQPTPTKSPEQLRNGGDAGRNSIEAAAPTVAVDEQKQVIEQNSAFALSALLSLGELVSLMMRSPGFQSVQLSSIAAMVAPALATGQFIVARAQSKDGTFAPIGACLWASVSEEVDARLSQNLDQPIKLSAEEWKGGDIPWAITILGDQRVLTPMLRQMRKDNLQGRPLKMRVRSKDGATTVHVLSDETTSVRAA